MRKPSQRGRGNRFASRIANLFSTKVILADLANLNTTASLVQFYKTF